MSLLNWDLSKSPTMSAATSEDVGRSYGLALYSTLRIRRSLTLTELSCFNRDEAILYFLTNALHSSRQRLIFSPISLSRPRPWEWPLEQKQNHVYNSIV